MKKGKAMRSMPPDVQHADNLSFSDRLLCCALDIGEQMLINGGEVHRVEDAIERICRSYGAVDTEVFCISSLMIATVRMEDGSYSNQMRRIYNTGYNLTRLEKMNSISRKICSEKMSFDKIDAMIKDAQREKPYPVWLSFLGSILATGAFAVFFGGNIMDGIAAAIIGVILTVIDTFHHSYINQMARTVISSFVAGTLSYLMVYLGVGCNTDKIMIGTIMLLVPGMAFGNALRDLLVGDILAGTLKIVQSLLIAVMIAFGYGIAIVIMGGIFK